MANVYFELTEQFNRELPTAALASGPAVVFYPDRILELAPVVGQASTRAAVQAAVAGNGRRAVVLALAEEADMLQQRDRRRVQAYDAAAVPFVAECRRQGWCDLPLREAHARLSEAAERLLPVRPTETVHENAQ